MSEQPHDLVYANYTEALKQYREKVRGDRVSGDDPLSKMLDLRECEMLNNPPPGRTRGLLLQKDRPTEAPKLRLKALTLEELDIKVYSDSEVRDILTDPNRTPPKSYVKDILDQDGIGSCAAEAACGALMCRRNQDGQERIKLNPWVPYRTTSGGRDQGSTLYDNLAYLQQFGAPSQEVWSRDHHWREKPSAEAVEDALNYRIPMDGVAELQNWAEFRTAVLKGFPVQFGYPGHSIFSDDLLDESRLIYGNSWEESWGDWGHASLHNSRIVWGYGAYAVIAARWGGN